jgi:hypothetical protein
VKRSASLPATLCQHTCVSGCPWISSSGGPFPPINVLITAPSASLPSTITPRVRTNVCRKPGNIDRFADTAAGGKGLLAPPWIAENPPPASTALASPPAMMVAPSRPAPSRSLRLMSAALCSITSISFIGPFNSEVQRGDFWR